MEPAPEVEPLQMRLLPKEQSKNYTDETANCSLMLRAAVCQLFSLLYFPNGRLLRFRPSEIVITQNPTISSRHKDYSSLGSPKLMNQPFDEWLGGTTFFIGFGRVRHFPNK